MSSPFYDQNSTTPLPSNRNGNHSPLRYPVLDDNAHILIPLVVVIPIVVAVLLCVTTVCIYRHKKKKRAQTNASESSIISTDGSDATLAKISRKSECNPIIMDGSPPSYDIISETKKNRQHAPENNNTNAQLHLSTVDTISSSISK